MPTKLRLNKFLRDCGLGSRRKCEQLVAEGRVEINGEAAVKVAALVNPDKDEVRVDGEVVRPFEEEIYIAAYKPRGVLVTASDPQGRKTVYGEIADLPDGLFCVGRLDMDSEGLLLMTNDGKMAHRLSHPRFEIEKVYRVWVRGRLDDAVVGRLLEGIELEDGTARAKAVEAVDDWVEGSVIEITLTEGKKREIRRMLAACGYEVTKLTRTRFGCVELGGLKEGVWRELERSEVRGLRRMVQEAYLAKKRD